MRAHQVLIMLACLAGTATTSEAACFDVSRSQPQELTGTIRAVIFAGSPGFADVRKGDMPEPGFLLRLNAPICLSGDEFAEPDTPFLEVHLATDQDSPRNVGSFEGKRVTVQLRNPMAAHTGHHHRPLVAWIAAIGPASGQRDAVASSATAEMTVRAFYGFLSSGQGRDASSLVIPEKRASGPFSAQKLTGFYGSLAKPLEVLGLTAQAPDSFEVRYRFASRSTTCDGRAVVQTVQRNGAFLIQAIRALDGC